MAVSRFCLDTSSYSRLRGGDAQVAALLDSADWVGVPVIALGELQAGFRRGSRPDQNLEELNRFLADPIVSLIDVGREASFHYADIVNDLRRSGNPLPLNDVWIAASAAASGSIVLTYDKHFRVIGRVGSIVLEA